MISCVYRGRGLVWVKEVREYEYATREKLVDPVWFIN
jgi:hypothetical protein